MLASGERALPGGTAHRVRTLAPTRSTPAVFYDPRSLLVGPGGVLHAKAVIADGEAALVTSANLTEAAFDRNIEVGLLARSRAIAENLTKHFRVLIERGMLRALPPG